MVFVCVGMFGNKEFVLLCFLCCWHFKPCQNMSKGLSIFFCPALMGYLGKTKKGDLERKASNVHTHGCIFGFNGTVEGLKIITESQEGWVRGGKQVLIAYFLRAEPLWVIFLPSAACLPWVKHALIAHSLWQEETCKSAWHLKTFSIWHNDWVSTMFVIRCFGVQEKVNANLFSLHYEPACCANQAFGLVQDWGRIF